EWDRRKNKINRAQMDEIARHIHKAKGLLYYYFNSKEELFNAVLEKELDDVQAELSKEISGSQDSMNMLKRYILKRFHLLKNAVNYQETLQADFFDKYHFVAGTRERFSEFERLQLASMLTRGQNEGFFSIKSIPATVDILMMIISGMDVHLFLQHKYDEYKKSLEEFSILIVNSVKKSKTYCDERKTC
ncbi:MAG TPA: helix-turn-helix domain-containing protein, partial [Bacteroidales bacterium]|nr:helix-turn-helix domain-containing protein [Bacteroidales bacterium]